MWALQYIGIDGNWLSLRILQRSDQELLALSGALPAIGVLQQDFQTGRDIFFHLAQCHSATGSLRYKWHSLMPCCWQNMQTWASYSDHMIALLQEKVLFTSFFVIGQALGTTLTSFSCNSLPLKWTLWPPFRP